MTDTSAVVYRVAWIEGNQERAQDYDTCDEANRHANWLQRRNGELRFPVKACVYAIKVWPHTEAAS